MVPLVCITILANSKVSSPCSFANPEITNLFQNPVASNHAEGRGFETSSRAMKISKAQTNLVDFRFVLFWTLLHFYDKKHFFGIFHKKTKYCHKDKLYYFGVHL